jgi:hypothetical protein
VLAEDGLDVALEIDAVFRPRAQRVAYGHGHAADHEGHERAHSRVSP